MENILGKRMKSLREAKEIRQKQVADSLGISPYQLSRYESGKSKPDPELIADIATYFDVSTDYLLGLDREENKFEYYKNKIVTEFPDIDLMFHDMESLTAEDLKDVYEFIKFKKSQQK